MSGLKKKRVMMVLGDIDMSHQLLDLIAELKSHVELRCVLIAKRKPSMAQVLEQLGVYYYHIDGGKISLAMKMLNLILTWRPEIIHSHLRRANLSAMPAAWLLGVKKRIHTRHSSDYNHVHHPEAVRWDKLVNGLSTDIIAISELVQRVLIEQEAVKPEKIRLIHHGFKLDRYQDVSEKRKQSIQTKYEIPTGAICVGIVARWLELKGIPFIIAAFSTVLEQHPKAILLLANAHGPYAAEIESSLKSLPSSSYRLIPFEDDMPALYGKMFMHIHTPTGPTCEAFGQTYVEALAARVPSVFTLSGVAHEFIEHEQNALVVPYQDSSALAQAMTRLLTEDGMPERLMQQGHTSVKRFSLEQSVVKLLDLYAQDKT